MCLRDRTQEDYFSTGKAQHWRRKVRYVGQHKIELLGTPKQFIQQIADLQSWRKSRQMARKRRQRLSQGSFRGGWGLLRLASPSSSIANQTSNQSIETNTAYRLAEQGMPEYEELLQSTIYLIQQWGLEASALDTKWKVLSGGEAQRVHVALAIASRPRILLLDEATSALDLDNKLRVESSIKQAAATYGMGVVWITHDDEQMKRLL
jgi:ABC-type dipeptide/oligopeptide/nickel transport system ATPase subunit